MLRNFITEFKQFINKGNLLGIAVGFVLGTAIAATVASLVDNIIMPIVAIPFGKPNFDAALVLTINDAEIRFGAFLTAVVTFVAIAFTVFWMLKAYNTFTGGEATAPPNEIVLLSGILEEMRGVRSEIATGNGGPSGLSGPTGGSTPPPPPPPPPPPA